MTIDTAKIRYSLKQTDFPRILCAELCDAYDEQQQEIQGMRKDLHEYAKDLTKALDEIHRLKTEAKAIGTDFDMETKLNLIENLLAANSMVYVRARDFAESWFNVQIITNVILAAGHVIKEHEVEAECFRLRSTGVFEVEYRDPKSGYCTAWYRLKRHT